MRSSLEWETGLVCVMIILAAGAGLTGHIDQGHGGGLLPTGFTMFGNDGRENAAADIELGRKAHKAGCRGGHQIVENTVCDGFMEGALVAEAPHVELEAFELDTALIGNVVENQGREIGLPGFWAKTREFRDFHVNDEVTLRRGVRESFQRLARLRAHRVRRVGLG